MNWGADELRMRCEQAQFVADMQQHVGNLEAAPQPSGEADAAAPRDASALVTPMRAMTIPDVPR